MEEGSNFEVEPQKQKSVVDKVFNFLFLLNHIKLIVSILYFVKDLFSNDSIAVLGAVMVIIAFLVDWVVIWIVLTLLLKFVKYLLKEKEQN